MVIARMFEASWWLHESPLVEVPVALTISGSFLVGAIFCCVGR